MASVAVPKLGSKFPVAAPTGDILLTNGAAAATPTAARRNARRFVYVNLISRRQSTVGVELAAGTARALTSSD